MNSSIRGTEDVGENLEPPRARSDLIFRELGEGWALYDPRNGQLHLLNLTATILWQALDGTRSREELAEELRSAYSDAPAELTAEVEAALTRFQEEGLLE